MPPTLDPNDPNAKGMHGPICPGCESTNVVVSSARSTNSFRCPSCGWSEKFSTVKSGLDPSEQHKLRRRQCRHCKTTFVTAEITLVRPDGSPVPWYWLNETQRQENRERARRKHGYHGLRINPRTITRSAVLHIKAIVFPPNRDWNETEEVA